MDWHQQADNRARTLLEHHAKELSDEAERVARRVKAECVSVDYVNEAAFTIRIRRPSGLGDVLLAIGIGMLGIAGGVLAIVTTSPTPLNLKSWVEPTTIAVACGGFLLSGIGGAMKVRSS